RPSRSGFDSRTGATVDIVTPPERDCTVILSRFAARMTGVLLSSPPMWQYTPRVAVMRGLRTPFAKSGTHYAHLSALDLGRSAVGKLGAFTRIRPRDLAPDTPAIAESSTGLTMGESAEKMAKENGISREAQDRFALQSHLRAAQATADGRFKEEVMTVVVPPKFDNVVDSDNLIRADTTLEALSKLRPVFDRKYGSITAGNASPLTDG